MAFAELWLPVIGAGICVAWAIGAWYGGSKVLSIWLAFGGIVCLLFLGALQFQHAIEKHETVVDEATKLARRAFLNVDDWQFENIGPNLNPTIRYRVRNTGPTAATITDDGSELRYAVDLVGAPAVVSHPSHTIVTGHGFVVAVLENPPAPEITPDRYARMTERQEFIFVYGRLIYRDIFEDEWELGFLTRIEAVPGTPPSRPTFRNIFPNEPSYSYLR